MKNGILIYLLFCIHVYPFFFKSSYRLFKMHDNHLHSVQSNMKVAYDMRFFLQMFLSSFIAAFIQTDNELRYMVDGVPLHVSTFIMKNIEIGTKVVVH